MPSNSQKLESVLLKALLIFCGFICFFVATSPSKVLAADDADIAVVGEKLGINKWSSVKEFKQEINNANTRLCNPREADDAKRGSDFEHGGCAGWISMAENGKWYPIQIVVDRRSDRNKNEVQQTKKNEAQQTMIFLCRFGYTGDYSYRPNNENNLNSGAEKSMPLRRQIRITSLTYSISSIRQKPRRVARMMKTARNSTISTLT